MAALAKWEFGRQIGGSGLLVSNPQQPILYVTQLGGEIHKLNLMDPLNMPQKLETINPISDIRSTPEIVCSLRLQTTKDKSLQARIAVASEDSIYYIVDDKLQWKIHVRFFFQRLPDHRGPPYCASFTCVCRLTLIDFLVR